MKLLSLLAASAIGFACQATAIPLLSGLSGKLQAAFPGRSSAAIESILVDSLAVAARNEGLSGSDTTCVRDYSGCPSGWSDSGSGICSPPFNYAGSCGSVDFGGLTPSEKGELAAGCDAKFSCMGGCRKNYATECPAGWHSRDGNCHAPASYNGACVPVTKFFGDKDHWETVCGVSWPCA